MAYISICWDHKAHTGSADEPALLLYDIDRRLQRDRVQPPARPLDRADLRRPHALRRRQAGHFAPDVSSGEPLADAVEPFGEGRGQLVNDLLFDAAVPPLELGEVQAHFDLAEPSLLDVPVELHFVLRVDQMQVVVELHVLWVLDERPVDRL